MRFEDLADCEFSLGKCVILRMTWGDGDVLCYNTKYPRKNQLIYYQLSGVRDYSLMPSGSCTMKAGDWAFISMNSMYRTAVRERCDGYAVDFNITGKDGCELDFDEPFCFSHDGSGRIQRVIEEMKLEFDRQTAGKLGVHAAFYKLLAELVSAKKRTAIAENKYAAILPAIEFIERSPESGTSIAELARSCCINETTFRKLFSEYTGGVPPLDYRNVLRIKKAALLLTSADCSVEYAAELTGFCDASHFCRIFTKYMNITPGKYKRSLI